MKLPFEFVILCWEFTKVILESKNYCENVLVYIKSYYLKYLNPKKTPIKLIKIHTTKTKKILHTSHPKAGITKKNKTRINRNLSLRVVMKN